jgi:hypothetical protein
MGVLSKTIIVASIAGAAYGGFYYGERLAIPESYNPGPMSKVDPDGPLCTFYPVFLPSSRSGPLSLVERESHAPNVVLSVPELTPWWIKQYTKAFEREHVRYVVKENAIRIPCRYYDNLDFLTTTTEDAGGGERPG